LAVERNEDLRTKPAALISDHAVREIAARIELRQPSIIEPD